MSLADKIMQLRKQQGWSQIDLADRLDVSRQSVSKWEMAQAVPELDKIIKLSELFDVTTDYLLKDNATDNPPPPEPESEPEQEPQPEPEPVPAPEPQAKPPKKKWPLVVAAVVVFPIFLISVIVVLACVILPFDDTDTTTNISVAQGDIQPTPTPAPAEWTMEAESTDMVYEGPVMETYTYGKGETAMTGGPVSAEEMAAIAAEYEPFGVTYDAKDDQWYYDGEPIRVFTDIMTSNGQPLEAGNFRGIMRSFAGEGTIDIRTVRDYNNPDANGNGTLTGIETYDVTGDAVWTETP